MDFTFAFVSIVALRVGAEMIWADGAPGNCALRSLSSGYSAPVSGVSLSISLKIRTLLIRGVYFKAYD